MASGLVRMAMDEFYLHNPNNLTGLVQRYWSIVEDELADPRAKSYPFMDNPLPTIGMVITYLAWVMIIGPIYMRDKKPMNLRNMLIYYNAGQVILSAYMFYEHLMSGWLFDYNYRCQPVDYNDDARSRRMLNLCYVYYISKLTEFVDTIFFVLRKKKSQITWLHLYHHSLTPLEAWVLVKFIAGGNSTFPNILNNFVHVCMYFYYMMSAMGPQYQKYLWWKKYMTELQIAQFILCIGHTIRALTTDCKFPAFISALLLLNSSIFFVLFMNFYIQAYKKQRSTTLNATALTTNQQPQIASAVLTNGIKKRVSISTTPPPSVETTVTKVTDNKITVSETITAALSTIEAIAAVTSPIIINDTKKFD